MKIRTQIQRLRFRRYIVQVWVDDRYYFVTATNATRAAEIARNKIAEYASVQGLSVE